MASPDCINPYSRDSPSKKSVESDALPDDLTKDILARLAPRCLMRFRAVSKSWRDLIDSPEFVKQHLDRSSMPDSDHHIYLHRTIFHLQRMNFFTTRFDREGPTHDELTHHPIPPPQFHMVKLVGSCNGLVCCVSNYMINNVILWNPWIRRSYKIPRLRGRGYRVQNTVRHFHYGFGYNRSTDDYKVVRLVNHVHGPSHIEQNPRICDVNIYSWKKKSWSRKLRNLPYCVLTESNSYRDCSLAEVFAESCIHWLANNGSIVAIDIGSNDHRVFRQPESVGKHGSVLGELGGCLCIVNCLFDRQVLAANPVSASLWVMKEYGNVDSWTRIIVSVPSGFGSALMRPIRYYCAGNDNKEIVLHNNEQLQWYDLEQQSVVRTADIPGPSFVFEWYHCVQTLVRPSVG